VNYQISPFFYLNSLVLCCVQNLHDHLYNRICFIILSLEQNFNISQFSKIEISLFLKRV
jgi:hypothetical protein